MAAENAAARGVGASRVVVQVFAKSPVLGQVKTRLVPALGPTGALRLHCRLVRRTLRLVEQAGLGPAELWTTAPGEAAFAVACGEPPGVPVCMQGDGDLGARMSRAMADGLRRADHAILLGTDVPGLGVEDLVHARQALEQGCQAVLGPAEDGGYYLLGLARHHPALFADVPWGEAEVLERTRERLRTLGWRWHELAVRWDVDRPEDCERLARDPALAGLLADLPLPA